MIKRGKRVCSRSDFLIRSSNILKSKRSQFYLVAAIIIAMVVFSLATVSNYARIESRKTDVFDLRSELGLEGGHVIDFALYSKENVSKLLENWTEVYVAGTRDKEIENWVFVYGNPKKGITVLAFTLGSAGTISVVDSGGISSFLTVETSKKSRKVYSGNHLNVTFGNFTYAFNTASEQNFAFLIKKGGYVADSGVTETAMSEKND